MPARIVHINLVASVLQCSCYFSTKSHSLQFNTGPRPLFISWITPRLLIECCLVDRFLSAPIVTSTAADSCILLVSTLLFQPRYSHETNTSPY